MVKKSLHIFYSGSVQGVGFRYAAERAANLLDLTGWVKNLSDGRVEIFVEGDKPALEGFLQKMSEVFKGYVRDIDVQWSEPTGEFTFFDVRF